MLHHLRPRPSRRFRPISPKSGKKWKGGGRLRLYRAIRKRNPMLNQWRTSRSSPSWGERYGRTLPTRGWSEAMLANDTPCISRSEGKTPRTMPRRLRNSISWTVIDFWSHAVHSAIPSLLTSLLLWHYIECLCILSYNTTNLSRVWQPFLALSMATKNYKIIGEELWKNRTEKIVQTFLALGLLSSNSRRMQSCLPSHMGP